MRKLQIALGVASAFGLAGTAGAAVVTVELTRVNAGSSNGETAAGTAPWAPITGNIFGVYDTGTGIVTMGPGNTSIVFNLTPLPNNVLYTHNHSGWSTGAGGYTTSAYSCVEGQFGPNVGAALCGNYNYGANYVEESSVNYGSVPGTRTLGGDDVVVGPQQQGSDYATSAISLIGSELLMESSAWNTLGAGGTSTGGIQLVFATPVPAAVWLFGSALGLLGWARRKST